MKQEPNDDRPDSAGLPVVGESGGVPVFDCHVIVSPSDERGVVTVRMTRLPDITASGPTEREALQRVVAAFKVLAQEHVTRGEQIPWASEPLKPQDGESERWIPVHL